jgi:hypothetical protein
MQFFVILFFMLYSEKENGNGNFEKKFSLFMNQSLVSPLGGWSPSLERYRHTQYTLKPFTAAGIFRICHKDFCDAMDAQRIMQSTHHAINAPCNQRIMQSTLHAINAPCNQRTMQSTHHAINASCNQCIMQSTHHAINASCNQRIMQSTHHAINASCNQRIMQSTSKIFVLKS